MAGRLLLCLSVACVALFASADTAPGDSPNDDLMSLGRMGAGAPAGWVVSGDGHEWKAEPGSGPLGVGAARIQFSHRGRLEIVSPACALTPEAPCALGLWLRCEPAGVTIDLAVRDNDTEEIMLGGAITASDVWTFQFLSGVLKKAVKQHYYLTLSAGAENATLWLDGLCLAQGEQAVYEAWRPAVQPVGVVLEPVAAWGVSAGDEPLEIHARVVGATQHGCRLQLQAAHTNGMTAPLPDVPLDDSGIWDQTFEVNGPIAQPFGMVRVEAVVVGPEGESLSASSETLLAHVPATVPGPLPDSPFGIHVRLREPDVAAVAKLGYKWCRIHDADASTKWGYAEPEPGKWVWFDDRIALARKHGLSILGLLDGSPEWERGDGRTGYWAVYGAPKSIENWRNYVRRVVDHYAGAIDEWEVWNEPWDMQRFFKGGSPKLYAELLKAAYQEAKAVNPACTIVGVDTYPPFWDAMVLAFGALPYYDVLSWHRYDPTLHGRPNDAIARVTQRIEAVQARHGTPKPTLCSEGGPDVAPFHGSFFSFADPAIAGDWSRGADVYARWFLSAIAAGNQRAIIYSVHNAPRHGRPIHMAVEPGYLLRPMHTALAALAHFIEGGRYQGRLAPAHDVTALVFHQPNARPFAKPSSTIAVLYSNGPDDEPLPKPLPHTVECFDRWANPIDRPARATRSPVYIVAASDAKGELLDALEGAPAPPTGARPMIDALLDNTLAALTQSDPPLWALFSSQASVAVLGGEQPLAVTRAQLRSDPALASRFVLPPGLEIAERERRQGGPFVVGAVELSGKDSAWTLAFAATPDGPNGQWRHLSLTLAPVPVQPAPEQRAAEAIALAKRWEQALVKAHTRDLHGHFYGGPCCAATATLNGEYLVFDDLEYLVTMLNTGVLWGPAQTSVMSIDRIDVSGNVAALMGKWDIASMAFGAGAYAFTATYIDPGDGWKLASLCAGAGPLPSR